MPTDREAVGVVVAAVVLVVAVTVIPAVLAPQVPGFQAATVDHPEYDPATLLADRADATGDIDPANVGEGQVVLIDAAHLNQFDRANINPLLRAFTEAGFEIRFYSGTQNFAERLAAADVFLVMTPRVTYTENQVETVNQFTDNGGQLVLVGEPTQAEIVAGGLAVSVVETNDRPEALARSYGINYHSRYIYNLNEYAGVYHNLFATPASDGPLASGVDRMVVYTATQVETETDSTIFETGANTHIAGTGTTTTRGVVVRSGNVIAISDQTLFSTDRFANADNEVFIENLVEYLARN